MEIKVQSETSPTISNKMFQVCDLFQQAAYEFFRLNKDQSVMEKDRYWNVTPFRLTMQTMDLFEHQIMNVLPDLQLLPFKLDPQLAFFVTAQYYHKLQEQFKSTFENKSNHTSDHKLNHQSDTTVSNKLPKNGGGRLIGLTGKKRHGKSTVAGYLRQEEDFLEYSFAAPLKKGCQILFSFSDDQLDGESKDQVDPRWGVTPRLVLQRVGTDLFRNQLDRYFPGVAETLKIRSKSKYNLDQPIGVWIGNFDRWYESLSNKPQPDYLNYPAVVISDVRFPDEADFIRCFKGSRVVRVVRPNYDTKTSSSSSSSCASASSSSSNSLTFSSSASSTSSVHASETEQDNIRAHAEIVNDMDLEHLRLKTITCLYQLGVMMVG